MKVTVLKLHTPSKEKLLTALFTSSHHQKLTIETTASVPAVLTTLAEELRTSANNLS
jgi:hypothetical protein